MGDNLRRHIYLNFSHRQTEELVDVWRAQDCNEWSEVTFDVIREILRERGVEPPPQEKPVHEIDESGGLTPLRPKTVFYAVYRHKHAGQWCGSGRSYAPALAKLKRLVSRDAGGCTAGKRHLAKADAESAIRQIDGLPRRMPSACPQLRSCTDP
jgi:hypothetical protein